MILQDVKLRHFKQVDVFTAIPGYGNALAVVVDADGLSDQDMQRLARWTNLSENAFIFAPLGIIGDLKNCHAPSLSTIS